MTAMESKADTTTYTAKESGTIMNDATPDIAGS